MALILSFIYPFSVLLRKICVTVFSRTVQAGIFKFGIHMENERFFYTFQRIIEISR